MTQYSDEQILDGILKHTNKVLRYIYQHYYPVVANLVTKNSGGETDAKDLFQESILVIYDKLRYDELTLTCTFKTYMYSIARNIWLNELKKNNKTKDSIDITESEIEEDLSDVYDAYISGQRAKLFRKYFEELSEDCRKIISLFLNRRRTSEITQLLGYGSEKYTRTRHYKCKQYLIEKIKKDPKYKQFAQYHEG